MSRPKELNFFVAELNWELGRRLVREPLRPRRRRARRDLAPLHQPPRFDGRRRADARDARRDARIVYMVRDPIDRMLSHYLHNVGGGYETRPLEEALGRPRHRLRRPQPLRDAARALPRARSAASGSLIVAREELHGERDDDDAPRVRVLRRRRRASPPAVRARVGDGQRQGAAGGFRLMDRAVRLPGPARARPQLRPPARVAALAWSSGSSTTRTRARRRSPSSPELRERLEGLLRDDVGRARADRRAQVRLVCQRYSRRASR